MPQLDPTYYPTQLFWLIVVFSLLFVVLWKIALPRISRIREVRQSRIEADLGKAKAVKIEAESVLAAYENSLAKASAKAQEIIHKVSDEMSAERARRLDEVAQSIVGRVLEAEAAISHEEQRAAGEVNSLSADLVCLATEKLGCGDTSNKNATAAIEAALVRVK
tara:strand:+ start:204 stop:695 length:492 start_codon:yes stop_codon:yes gene_type:complete